MDKQPMRNDWRERGRYHRARGRNTSQPPLRNGKLSYWLLPMLLVFGIMASRRFNAPPPPAPSEQLLPGASYIYEPKLYTPDDLRAVIDKCANNSWGAETMDKAEILLKSFIYWQQPEVGEGGLEAAIGYLTLLIRRDSPDEAKADMLEPLALFLGDTTPSGEADPQALERYRLALQNVHSAA